VEVRWYGQSAFRLEAEGRAVVVDPFGEMSGRGWNVRWTYPPVRGVTADLLLVTHEHADHNGVDGVAGSPHVVRSTAGTFDTPLGQVLAVASEHDDQAGTRRGPNTIFVFSLGGLRVCHFGDFGQRALRPEQAEAIGRVDLLLVPVGGGPTIDAAGAADVVRRLAPRWVVPMHYRTPAIGFLEPADAFLANFGDVRRLDGPAFDPSRLPPAGDGPCVLVPSAPGG
jgi:L-ascorbate metabolism protein UlaG (beta-lactamase superfamily)